MKPGLSVSPGRLQPIITTEADRSKRRDTSEPWRPWYRTKRWYQLRWQVLVRDLFTCQHCKTIHHDTSLLVAHHKQRHCGNAELFWSSANLACVCKACHDGPIKASERRGASNL
jgi:5-methylcytosine-specific restriction enzyme A